MGEKKVLGRKRHIAVDTQGNLLYSVVHAADVLDRDGLWDVIDGLKERFPTITHVWVDGGYRGCEDDMADCYRIQLDVVKKHRQQQGFVVLPRRWVVERTFAWFNRYRVLSKEYTHECIYSETFLMLASVHRMLRRCFPNIQEIKPYKNK